MTPDETFLMANLCAIACRRSTGRLLLNRLHSQTMLDLYEAEPGYAHFDITSDMVNELLAFKKSRRNTKMCALLIAGLDRAARGKCMLNVGRKMALGLLVMFDCDVRRRAERLLKKWEKQDGE
jgi:hypothetical protein